MLLEAMFLGPNEYRSSIIVPNRFKETRQGWCKVLKTGVTRYHKGQMKGIYDIVRI